MAKKTKRAALVLLLIGLVAGAASCVVEDRKVEFVLNDETCVQFSEYQTSESFQGTPQVVDFADDVDRILDNNDVSRSDVMSANLESASYGVASFSQAHDWVISGSITVERTDKPEGPFALIHYTSQSVQDAVGKKIPAQLDSAGVGLINRALKDYLSDQTSRPRLVFRVNNGSAVPAPSFSDPLQFDWQACVVMDIVAKSKVSVPDPF